MFLPANTVIKITPTLMSKDHVGSTKCVVQEITHDFDPDFVNGVKVKLEGGGEKYIDDLHYLIEVLLYPPEYYNPNKEWFVVQGKLDPYMMFCSDGIYANNKWMQVHTDIVERIDARKIQTYKEGLIYYKKKYLTV